MEELRFKGLKILVVEDEADTLDILDKMLTRRGVEVITARHGLQALARLDESEPDLILCDVMMPKMDGYELCKRIRSHPRYYHLPIVFLTASKDQNEREKCIQNGADGFTAKPVLMSELKMVVGSLMRFRARIERYTRDMVDLKNMEQFKGEEVPAFDEDRKPDRKSQRITVEVELLKKLKHSTDRRLQDGYRSLKDKDALSAYRHFSNFCKQDSASEEIVELLERLGEWIEAKAMEKLESDTLLVIRHVQHLPNDQQITFNEEDRHTFAMVDDESSISQICEISSLGRALALNSLSKLFTVGVIILRDGFSGKEFMHLGPE